MVQNDLFVNLDVKGLIINATTVHDWADFIPQATEPVQNEDFVLLTNNTINLKVTLSHIALDYTPCVTQKSCLEVYKNYSYKIDDEEDGDSSDDSLPRGEMIYKSNTRMVDLLGKLTLDITKNDNNMNMNMKLQNLAAYILWTQDYSSKWSHDLLIDNEKLIDSIMNDLLSRMGFVNIIKIEAIDMSLKKELLKNDPKTHKLPRKIKKLASLPDIYQSDTLEIPTMIMLKDIHENGPAEISINLSKVLVFLCHDSILGTFLFSKTAELHINKAMKRISKKTSKVVKQIDKDKKIFNSVIKEEEDDSSDEEKKNIDISKFVDYHKFGRDSGDIYLEKKLSNQSMKIRQDFDIIDDFDTFEKRNPYEEGTVVVHDKFEFIHDYIDTAPQGKDFLLKSYRYRK